MKELALIAAAAILCWSLTGIAVRALGRRYQALPNERSMHDRPVPVGGGLAIVATLAILAPLWAWPMAGELQVVVCAMLALAAVSWVDDIRPLWPLTRLAAQALVVTICLGQIPETSRLAADVPLLWERLALGVFWLWMINLTNFMDGIDGLAASEAIAVALGYVGVVGLAASTGGHSLLALLLAAAAAGYLVWNWQPARIFMGDVGSIPLGFLFGWLTLDLALRGSWPAALILPAYFLADATLTMLARLVRGELPWQPHRSHFYQRAVLAGVTHADVVKTVAFANAVLLVLALLSVRRPIEALAAAATVVAVLLAVLARAASGRRRSNSDPAAR